MSADEVTERAIQYRAARHGLRADIREALAHGADEWADVLKRLLFG